ncbi:MAG: hypothetical protein HZC36_09195 [Armatimonadetes bacterium]|nr:hypothetical protein [Armatimonadota bacterium]
MLSSVAAALFLSSQDLKIDPLLIRQVDAIYKVIGNSKNPVWPGWDASQTPILIYFPGRQDVLIHHPKPPEGFKRYSGPVTSAIGPIWVRDGATQIEWDGQNTSMDVNGVQTLVVADTLSSRRQWIESLFGANPKPDQVSKAITDGLFGDPYGAMLMFAHEAFHVYQRQKSTGKEGHELTLGQYPALSVENNVGMAMEADCLAEALQAQSKAAVRSAAIRWLVARNDRRAQLSSACKAYEDGTEFNEGLAKFVEYKLLQVLEGAEPPKDLWLIQGFRGYKDLSAPRNGLINQMKGFMSGAFNINNDPYGASPVRFRLYYSGMGVAALLDRLGATWQDRILQPGTSLTSLAAEAIGATPAEMDSARASLRGSSRYAELAKEKAALRKAGEEHVAKVLAEFDAAPSVLIIDFSALSGVEPSFSFTPFGILSVDDDRMIFRMLPLRGSIGKLKVSESEAKPVLYDRSRRRVTFQLKAPPDTLPEGDSVNLETLDLPGVSLKKVKGHFQMVGKRIELTLTN